MLISRVLPIMAIYHLPHGQYRYSGHVLNLPQDVATFVNTLPRCPADLDVIIVRKEGATDSHKDFRVRQSVVLRALQWLVENNIYYRDITIDHSVLALLPTDGELSNLQTMTVSSSTEVDTTPVLNDPHDAHLGSTFLPMPTRGVTEQEVIQQSIDQSCSRGVTEQEVIQQSIDQSRSVSWPSTSGNPVNEFTTEGYMSCAFPTLFSTGEADYLVPRPRSVSMGNYFKHLMLHHDQRFAKHPLFRYVCM